MRPTLELVVDGVEAADLANQGLLVSSVQVADDAELVDERAAGQRAAAGKGGK
jgi:hypothetical protein